jgi:carbon monoxide dehydrogenase subunit G
MEMHGSRQIAAPREVVWAALNDAEVLKASIPGCQELTGGPDEGFQATVKQKVGPVSATFNGRVVLSNVVPLTSYTISGEGKGGAAGFAKGGAHVKLVEESAEMTVLSYTASADVGGKLAQLGSRLIDATAKKMADQFFENLRQQLTGPPSAPEATPLPAAAATPTDSFASLAQNKFVWAGAAVVVLMILALLFR